jgi:hypothetical protein
VVYRPQTVETYEETAGAFKSGTVQIQFSTPARAIWSEKEQEAVFQPWHVNYIIMALVQSYPWATNSFSSNKTEININKTPLWKLKLMIIISAPSSEPLQIFTTWLLQDPPDLCLTIHAHISKQCYLMWFSIFIFYTFLPLMQPVRSTHLNLLDFFAPSYELMGKLWSSPLCSFSIFCMHFFT